MPFDHVTDPAQTATLMVALAIAVRTLGLPAGNTPARDRLAATVAACAGRGHPNEIAKAALVMYAAGHAAD